MHFIDQQVRFTYASYKSLIDLLREKGYAIRNYHTWQTREPCVILRHDIDNDLQKAVELARVERELGVSSTYFVLLTSDIYNAASRASLDKLRAIRSMGHEIGLHFDEKAYPDGSPQETVGRILRERDLLAAILETPVTAVSMHRPSKATLEADLQIPGMVNSYGKTFFHDFKYLSDSRRHWREPVEDLVRSGKYERLHILTHAFWYHETEERIQDTVRGFIQSASRERYRQMAENITDLDAILEGDDSQW